MKMKAITREMNQVVQCGPVERYTVIFEASPSDVVNIKVSIQRSILFVSFLFRVSEYGTLRL